MSGLGHSEKKVQAILTRQSRMGKETTVAILDIQDTFKKQEGIKRRNWNRSTTYGKSFSVFLKSPNTKYVVIQHLFSQV